MPVHFSNAPGKIILFGEHAVVYGYPAIAIPVAQLKAAARVIPSLELPTGTIQISAPQINLLAPLSSVPGNHPIAAAVRIALDTVQAVHPPVFTLQVTSTIPISAGMGSSAAVTIAIIRAITSYFGHLLSSEEISNLAFEVEKIQHGTPSGIDNNVIAHQKPVYYQAGNPLEFLHIEQPTHWVIADTGIKASTRETVADVRKLYQVDQKTISEVFTAIGKISTNARQHLINGDLTQLGDLLNENQQLLERLTVSSQELDALVKIARAAGAAGAKLSGGGRGGNIIALASPGKIEQIQAALHEGGARQVFSTILNKGRD